MLKMIKSVFPKMLAFFIGASVLCGVIFPMAITAIAAVCFPKQANGSILVGEDGTKYGSALLGQPFSGEQYLWGRPMNVDTSTYVNDNGEALLYSGASNKTPAGEELEATVAERVEKIRAAHPDHADEPVPVDLVTISGSGLDPDISPAAAEYQVSRIAKARGISEDEVRSVIDKYTTGRLFGVFGEPAVNVLKVNLTLDGIQWTEE